jgi:hypothetical protein
MPSPRRHVRFTPDSGHQSPRQAGPQIAGMLSPPHARLWGRSWQTLLDLCRQRRLEAQLEGPIAPGFGIAGEGRIALWDNCGPTPLKALTLDGMGAR